MAKTEEYQQTTLKVEMQLKVRAKHTTRPIELVDGEHLAEKLRELRLGLKIETVEQVFVDEDWFKAISASE